MFGTILMSISKLAFNSLYSNLILLQFISLLLEINLFRLVNLT